MAEVKTYADDEMALIGIEDPITYKQAQESEESALWNKAMRVELDELQRQKTWELVKLPPNRKPLRGRWVFKTKQIPGQEPIYKARWVAKGFQQKPGVDFSETFANTVTPTAYRLLLAIAAYNDWEIEQWDVKSAYPNATLHDEVYIQQPTGFEDPEHPELVCRCLKALYGLKQAAREWQQFLKTLLGKYGLIPLKSDQGVFKHQKKTLVVITYVDDLLIIAKDIATIRALYEGLKESITINDLGRANTFLGIEITRDRPNRAISLGQTAYTKRILDKFNYKIDNIVKPMIPIDSKIAPSIEKSDLEFTRNYQQQVGSIMYLMTKTRPDLAYSVGLCARFMANPTPEHEKALKKIWKYLSHTWNFLLNYRSTPQGVITYCDADHAGDLAARRSTTAYLCLYRGGAISWNSRLQKTIALSSTESEYMALKEAIKEQIFIRSLISEINDLTGPISVTDIYSDSRPAIDYAKDPLFHHRMKHVDIQLCFIREKIQEGISKVTYINTKEQPADALTKPISQKAWLRFIDNIGLSTPKSPIIPTFTLEKSSRNSISKKEFEHPL